MTEAPHQNLAATWKPLYLTGAIAALLAVFVFRRNLGAELSLLASFGLVHGIPAAPASQLACFWCCWLA